MQIVQTKMELDSAMREGVEEIQIEGNLAEDMLRTSSLQYGGEEGQIIANSLTLPSTAGAILSQKVRECFSSVVQSLSLYLREVLQDVMNHYDTVNVTVENGKVSINLRRTSRTRKSSA